MILTIDIGNTLIKAALYEKGNLVDILKIKSNLNRSSDEYAYSLKAFLGKRKCTGAIISSVVPLLTIELTEAVKRLTKSKVIILSRHLKTGVGIKIENPSELGTDFISEAVGALNKYKEPLLIADYGTSTKICVIDKNRDILGVTIAAGMGISLGGLVNNAAQLMATELEVPNTLIGKNTKESIQAGIVLGQAYMIESLADKIEEELGYKLTRVLTGGYSSIIKDTIKSFNYEPTVVNDGLYQIYLMNS